MLLNSPPVAHGWEQMLSAMEQDDVATLTQPGQPTHDLALPRRSLRDCLAEELRRLDPDDLFGNVVRHGVGQLDEPVQSNENRREP